MKKIKYRWFILVIFLIITIVVIINYKWLLIKYHIWRLGGATPPLYDLYEKAVVENYGPSFIFVLGVDYRGNNADALVRMGKEVIPYLKEIINNNYKPIQKLAALYIFNKINNSALNENIDIIIKASEDKDAVVRYQAIKIISKIRDKKVIPILIERLEDKGIGGSTYPALSIISKPRTLRAFALEQLISITEEGNSLAKTINISPDDLAFSDEKWIELKKIFSKWWDNNKDYIYCDPAREMTRYFRIDEEAKKSGIPTDEYRKTYPWPKEKKN